MDRRNAKLQNPNKTNATKNPSLCPRQRPEMAVFECYNGVTNCSLVPPCRVSRDSLLKPLQHGKCCGKTVRPNGTMQGWVSLRGQDLLRVPSGTCPVSPRTCSVPQDLPVSPGPQPPLLRENWGILKLKRLNFLTWLFRNIFARSASSAVHQSRAACVCGVLFRAPINLKMCKNDRILTKALIFLFIFMHFIN